MDEHAFDQIVERLKKANAVIEKLDPAIRADAFELLRGYVAGGKVPPPEDDTSDDTDVDDVPGPDADEDELISKFESEKDHENALLALAIVLKRYGKGPFKLKVVRDVADELNLTIPERVDVTFNGLKRDDAEVFRKQAGGTWKIMPGGEKWLKKTYGVSRGKQELQSG